MLDPFAQIDAHGFACSSSVTVGNAEAAPNQTFKRRVFIFIQHIRAIIQHCNNQRPSILLEAEIGCSLFSGHDAGAARQINPYDASENNLQVSLHLSSLPLNKLLSCFLIVISDKFSKATP